MTEPSSSASRVAGGIALTGAALLAVGVVLDSRRALFAYLTAYVFVASSAVGAVLFLAIAHTTGAGWMAVLRRRAEDIASVFPLLLVLLVPILLGLRTLYPWAAPAAAWSDEIREHVAPKAAFLSRARGYLSRLLDGHRRGSSKGVP